MILELGKGFFLVPLMMRLCSWCQCSVEVTAVMVVSSRLSSVPTVNVSIVRSLEYRACSTVIELRDNELCSISLSRVDIRVIAKFVLVFWNIQTCCMYSSMMDVVVRKRRCLWCRSRGDLGLKKETYWGCSECFISVSTVFGIVFDSMVEVKYCVRT
jgi:hypothetical protein